MVLNRTNCLYSKIYSFPLRKSFFIKFPCRTTMVNPMILYQLHLKLKCCADNSERDRQITMTIVVHHLICDRLIKHPHFTNSITSNQQAICTDQLSHSHCFHGFLNQRDQYGLLKSRLTQASECHNNLCLTS